MRPLWIPAKAGMTVQVAEIVIVTSLSLLGRVGLRREVSFRGRTRGTGGVLNLRSSFPIRNPSR
jgi:hypothetical protein